MMSQRWFAANLCYQLSLDDFVSQDRLLRRIAAAVDFSFVRVHSKDYVLPDSQHQMEG